MHSGYGTRLLSIGEIIDRAVHLTIANLLPLAAIIGLVDVPVRAIADWLDRDDLSHYFGAVGKIVADPRMFTSYFTLIQSPHSQSPWNTLLWVLASFLPLSLAVAAASIASEKILLGERLKVGAAYSSAIRRLGPVIGASILTFAMFTVAFVVVGVAASVPWIVWVTILASGGQTITSSQTVVLFALLIPSLAAVAVWMIPLTNCTFTGAALNAVRPFRALREAWTMTMSRGLRGRSFALGGALIAITVVEVFISTALCGVLSVVTHSSWLSFVARDLISLLALIFFTALAVVFYLDARNRTGIIQDPLAERENSQAQ